eukprot:Rhum_TRINITY_DN23413_c0_g1::Rhum_TRINITY_DN23413_c0_g1_i1::g.177958::m.177958
MGQCCVNGQGATEVIELIEGDSDEVEADFSGMKLSAAQITRLKDVVSASTALQTLVLSWCDLQDAGVATLCEGLSSNTSLTTLVLTGNRITDTGAEHLSAAMAGMSLETCNLSENRIGNKGFKTLLESAARSSTLVDLRLGGNRIVLDTPEEAADVLRPLFLGAGASSNLGFLDLRGCGVAHGLLESVNTMCADGDAGGSDGADADADAGYREASLLGGSLRVATSSSHGGPDASALPADAPSPQPLDPAAAAAFDGLSDAAVAAPSTTPPRTPAKAHARGRQRGSGAEAVMPGGAGYSPALQAAADPSAAADGAHNQPQASSGRGWAYSPAEALEGGSRSTDPPVPVPEVDDEDVAFPEVVTPDDVALVMSPQEGGGGGDVSSAGAGAGAATSGTTTGGAEWCGDAACETSATCDVSSAWPAPATAVATAAATCDDDQDSIATPPLDDLVSSEPLPSADEPPPPPPYYAPTAPTR